MNNKTVGFFSNTTAILLIAVVLSVTGWGCWQTQQYVQHSKSVIQEGEDFIYRCQVAHTAQMGLTERWRLQRWKPIAARIWKNAWIGRPPYVIGCVLKQIML